MKSAETEDPTEVIKGITDPAVQEVFKTLLSSQANLLAEIEKGKEEKETAKWVAVAKTWTHLPGKPEEIGANLRAVEKSIGEDAAKAFAAQMEAAQLVAKDSNLFRAAGLGGGPASDIGDKIEKAVKEQVEKFKTDGVSDEVAKAKAMQAVFTANPELYNEANSK
jgi:hypothetical protein